MLIRNGPPALAIVVGRDAGASVFEDTWKIDQALSGNGLNMKPPDSTSGKIHPALDCEPDSSSTAVTERTMLVECVG